MAKTLAHGFVTQSFGRHSELVPWLPHSAVHDSSCPLVCECWICKATVLSNCTTVPSTPMLVSQQIVNFPQEVFRSRFVVCSIYILLIFRSLMRASGEIKKYTWFSKTIITVNIIFRSLASCVMLHSLWNYSFQEYQTLPKHRRLRCHCEIFLKSSQ